MRRDKSLDADVLPTHSQHFCFAICYDSYLLSCTSIRFLYIFRHEASLPENVLHPSPQHNNGLRLLRYRNMNILILLLFTFY